MDFWFVATVSALLLVTVDPVEASEKGNGTKLNDSDTINETIPQTDVTTKPITSVLILGLVTVKWTSRCRGEVIMNNLDSVPSLSAVCYNASSIQLLLKDLCENKKGCEGATKFSRSGDTDGGYRILAKQEITQCETLSVKCKEERPPKVPTEPVGYKVATALLCCLLLLLFLIRFSKPTVKALQKRLSNKRQNRWIGPTQSHSVSYHRGQTTLNKTLDDDSRRSYSALDRLAVGNREPSSNRNSYNF